MNVQKVYDANVYVNNESTHGLAAEVVLPNVTAIMADYSPMGMIGSMELFNGFDKMESSIKWTYPPKTVLKELGNFLKSTEFMVRSSMAVYEDGSLSEEVPIVAYMTATSKEFQGGSFKAKEDTEVESNLAVTYFKLEVDGEEIIEVDVNNNIYKVDGVDLLAQRRENLGI